MRSDSATWPASHVWARFDMYLDWLTDWRANQANDSVNQNPSRLQTGGVVLVGDDAGPGISHHSRTP